MQDETPIDGLGSIVATLASHSSRPRYAFMLLQLVADAADGSGRAGPFIARGNVTSTIRDWLVTQLQPMSARDGRRAALRARVVANVADKLTGIEAEDAAMIEAEIADQVLEVGRQNVSRAMSDLVKAGLVSRHYAGYATNHANRGAKRHAVYVVKPVVMAALGRRMVAPTRKGGPQGEFQFAA
ncbi:MAG: hypothetical protein IPN84_17515 [Sphingomonadales bacterium]|jgi:hypothetical protein|nr:hypothetical protein [Sphingomonadales bacterium]